MFKVKVLTTGKTKESWLKEALDEYQSRLKARAEITFHLAKDEEQLYSLALLEPFIALDPNGEMLDSLQFANRIEKLGARATFLIGGAAGIPLSVLKQAKQVWSLSPLTFTHQMTRIILLEQIYRSIEIGRKSPYHK